MTSPPVIEKLTIVAPLGLCFHDAATGERVTEGLSVSVYPAAQKNIKDIWKKRTAAFPNRSGVYVLHQADGLKEFTRGAADAEFDKKDEDKKSFIVEVVDRENRFQPFQFQLKLPVKGIYRWESIPSASPNKNLSSIPLYSAPTRKVLGGMSVIRAELRERIIESPSLEIKERAASFAVLEAFFNGSLVARGIADRNGRIVLMFPSLSPQSNPITSPPSDATRVRLADQKWILNFTVKYQPQIVQTSPPISDETDEEVLPNLENVLKQKNGTLWVNAEKAESFTTAVLRIGKDLILPPREPQILSPMPPAETIFSSYLFVSPA